MKTTPFQEKWPKDSYRGMPLEGKLSGSVPLEASKSFASFV
jgi:hypothetical protein